MNEIKPTTHIVGVARTIRTTVMACEYLKERLTHPQTEVFASAIGFRFMEPTKENGWWSSEIIITMFAPLSEETSHLFVTACRAFVAGAGEIW